MKSWYKLFTIVGLFLTSLPLFGQRPSFEPSASAMVYGSQIDGDKYGGYDKANIALYIETERVNRKAIQWGLGLGFAQRGSFRKPDPDSGIFSQYKISLNYISVPLKLILKQKVKRSKTSYYAEFGAELLTLISSRESDENGDIDSRAEFKRITADGLLNLGLQQKSWSVFIAFRYSLLPARVLANKISNYDSNLMQFNNAVGVGIKRNF